MSTKILFFSAFAAACTILLGSCNKETPDQSDQDEEGFTGKVRLTMKIAQTKSTVSQNTYQWLTSDHIGVFTKSSTPVINSDRGMKLDEAGNPYFLAYMKAYKAGDQVYGYYPYAESNTSSSSVMFSIPASQSQPSLEEGVFDASAIPAVMVPHTFAADAVENTCSFDVNFRTLSTIGVLQFYSSSKYQGEKLQSVTISSDDAIAGDFYYDITTVTESMMPAIELEGDGSSVITVNYGSSLVVNSASEPLRMYFSMLPGTHKLTITFKTNVADYVQEIASHDYESGPVEAIDLDLDKVDSRITSPGTVGNPYYISSVDDLRNMSSLLVAYSEEPVVFKMTSDIDMTGVEWTPLDQTGECPISFDGQGHTISNLTVTSGGGTSFFGFLWGTVKNLNFDNAFVSAYHEKGAVVAGSVGLVGWGRDHCGYLENVHVTNSTVEHVAQENWVGWTGSAGIIAGTLDWAGSYIKNCSAVNCSVTSTYCPGGIVGTVNTGTAVDACFVKNVTVSGAAIMPASAVDSWTPQGWLDPTAINSFKVKCGYAGSIAGLAYDCTIYNCFSDADCTVIDTDPDRGMVGGILGCAVEKVDISYCWSEATLKGTVNAGGILGGTAFYVSGGNSVNNCIGWNPQIAAWGGTGRIAGYISARTDDASGASSIHNCYGRPDANLDATGISYHGIVGSDSRDGETSGEYYHGVNADDIISAAKACNFDESVWNLSGSRPSLK